MDKILYRNGKPLKIALIGGARTGKDTIAEYLIKKAGFYRLAFGDGLKDKLFSTFPDLPEEPKPRDAMILFGQACRQIDPLVWVKELHRTSRICEKNGIANFVITDVRQPNELEYCVKNGYLLVKVEARACDQVARALLHGEHLDVDNELDIMATNFTEYDYKIVNDGSLGDLYKQVDKLIEGWEK